MLRFLVRAFFAYWFVFVPFLFGWFVGFALVVFFGRMLPVPGPMAAVCGIAVPVLCGCGCVSGIGPILRRMFHE